MFDFDPSFLVRIHPHREKFHVSQGRTVFQVGADGIVAPESVDGLFVSRTRLLSVYRYLVDGKPPKANVVGNVKQHSWLGYYIALPPHWVGNGKDQGSGQMEEISEQTIELRVSRHVGQGTHEEHGCPSLNFRAVSRASKMARLASKRIGFTRGRS